MRILRLVVAGVCLGGCSQSRLLPGYGDSGSPPDESSHPPADLNGAMPDFAVADQASAPLDFTVVQQLDQSAPPDISGPMSDLSGLPPSCRNGVKDGDETDVDCGGLICPGCATGRFCFHARDCLSLFCTNNACDPPSCTDGVKNGDETDVDCGGATCARCPLGGGCLRGSDCQSATCTNNFCALPLCQDGRLDGTETDVDCGGTCSACPVGKMCLRASDCQSALCQNNVCIQPATCSDGVQNGRETDVDCGGGCPPCAVGKKCLAATDCVSNDCMANLCVVAPTCTDGVQNGLETDIDCGGGTCPKCRPMQKCGSAGDCLSATCTNGVCGTGPSCTDMLRNGGETDVDCGGPTCPPCAPGKNCLAYDDCSSLVCVNNVCCLGTICLPSCFDNMKDGSETDVDCGGGTCPTCADNHACGSNSDCTSGICTMRVCQPKPPTCTDGIQNGTETDVDCGGNTCPGCPDFSMCIVNTDCLSQNCLFNYCQPGAVPDGGVQDAAPDLTLPVDFAVPPDLVVTVDMARPPPDFAGVTLPKCPNIMFVIDRSGSMAADPNGGFTVPSKWQLAQSAVETEVSRYGVNVPFGLEMFTSSALDNATCYSDTKIDVEPAPGSAAQIAMLIGPAMPDSGTNTGEAIERAAADPAMHDPTRGDYVILITDGDPNCNSGDQLGMAAFTISEITAAAAQSPSVHTVVVGFDGSGGVNPDNLNAMAIAGLEPVSPCNATAGSPCYWSGYTATKFQAAIDRVVDALVHGDGAYAACAP
jgi:hypothetical protein